MYRCLKATELGSSGEHVVQYHGCLENYSWPLNNMHVRSANPPTVKNLSINLKVGPLYTRFLHIHSSSSTDSSNHGLCSTVVFTMEKILHISGPIQFKLVLLNSQL